ncbi:hypothetical protein Ahy_A05g024726 [Arachis hypogaea]|uniref:Uncharacterized protein n=1 Tax=Arachis hypogaea TaxID=3818 RepID=A0A445D6I1_ARAHY|nr:hypothetical protein Ahy_A05g024726 [Arachis hypogaea]
MKYAGKNPKAMVSGRNRKAYKRLLLETKKSRESTSGLSRSSKKGGHGGKFTWIGQDYWQMEIGPVALDANDPNFDDPRTLFSFSVGLS